MPPKYLNRQFFFDNYADTLEIITYYGLSQLVYYNQIVSLDLCTEFYNNLTKIDNITYTSRVASIDIIFTPDLIRNKLELHPSPS